MFNIAAWIEAFGLGSALFIMGAIIFAESGLLIGVLLPGDTLLIAAGVLSAQGHAPLALVVAVVTIGAVLGDNVGYFFGKKTGPKLFRRKDGLFFRRAYAKRAEAFFKAHGGKTVLFARFIPYIRTFIPIVAGVGRMDRRVFVTYNILGAFIWSALTVMAGYWVGGRLPEVSAYIAPTLGIGALFIFAPTIWHFAGIARNRKRVTALIAPRSGKRSARGSARPKRDGR